MIENVEQLQQAHEALGDLYRALALDRAIILSVNPRNYAVIAQGTIKEIRKIQSEIDDYLGLRTASEDVQSASAEPALLREEPREFRKAKQ